MKMTSKTKSTNKANETKKTKSTNTAQETKKMKSTNIVHGTNIMNNNKLVGQQGEYKNLVDFFEEYRPVMTDIVYIYYGIMTNENYKITIGERELNLEHVYYNCESGDVDVRVRYNYDIKRLLDYVCMALKYADEETRSFAIEFRTKYYKGQISECKLLLKDYIERLRYSHRVVTLQNVFFVAVIAIISFLLVIMHY